MCDVDNAASLASLKKELHLQSISLSLSHISPSLSTFISTILYISKHPIRSTLNKISTQVLKVSLFFYVTDHRPADQADLPERDSVRERHGERQLHVRGREHAHQQRAQGHKDC